MIAICPSTTFDSMALLAKKLVIRHTDQYAYSQFYVLQCLSLYLTNLGGIDIYRAVC